MYLPDSSIPLLFTFFQTPPFLSSIFIFVFYFFVFSHSFFFHLHLFRLTIIFLSFFLSLCFSLVLTHSQFLINNLSLLVSVGLTSSQASSTFSTTPPLPSHHHCTSTMPTMPPLPTTHQNPIETKTLLKKKKKKPNQPKSTSIKTQINPSSARIIASQQRKKKKKHRTQKNQNSKPTIHIKLIPNSAIPTSSLRVCLVGVKIRMKNRVENDIFHYLVERGREREKRWGP